MKRLKLTTLFIFFLSTILVSAQWGGGKKIKGNGKITTTNIDTKFYDDINVSGSMDFMLVTGKEGHISIKADSNLTEYIIVEEKNKRLIIKVKDGYNLKPSETIMITISYKDLNSVSLSGSGDVENSGTIKTNKFKVNLAGSGDINLNVESQSTESNIAGSGDIKLKGFTENLKTIVTGSGDFNGEEFKSTNVEAIITGSADIKAHCNGGELKVRIAGSGDVKYFGTPENIDSKITGSGSVSN